MRLLIIFLIFLLMGCGLFKKNTVQKQQTELLSSISEKKEQTLAQHSENTRYQFSIASDSSGQWYSVEIIPKGTFQFSADSGFKGEAQSLHWLGKSHQSHQQVNQESFTENTKLLAGQKENRTEQHEFASKQMVKKQSYRLGWLLAGILFLLIILYGCYKHWL